MIGVDLDVVCLSREDRGWCPLVRSAGAVRDVRLGDLPWGGRTCMGVYGGVVRSGRVQRVLWVMGGLGVCFVLGGVYVCG